jgi:hypothetical protein
VTWPGHWAVSWKCQASGTPILCRVRIPSVGFATGNLIDFDELGVTFSAIVRPVVVVCTEGTPCFQRGRTLVLTLEPPVSGARGHWGRNQCVDTDIKGILEQQCFKIGAVTARIHAVNRRGVGPVLPIIDNARACRLLDL